MKHFKKFIRFCEILLHKTKTIIVAFFSKFSKDDIYANGGAILVLSVIIVLYLINKIDIVTFISFLGSYLVFVFLLIRYIIEKHDKSVLVSFTTKYLLEPDKNRIDDILGQLINGKWARLKIDPLDDFFVTLSSLANNSNFETKRRLSEALPALFQLSFKHSKQLFDNLRDDVSERYKTDIRRRAIESLAFLLDKRKSKYILDNLYLIDTDEVYVALPIFEVLHGVKRNIHFKKERITEKYLQVMADIDKNFPHHADSFKTMWDLLELFQKDKEKSFLKCNEILLSDDFLFKIFIARNYRLLCKDSQNCLISGRCKCHNQKEIISFIERILKDTNKHVRRPIAKEISLNCLCLLVKNKGVQDRVFSVLQALFTDPDDIIRITAFDKIDNLLESKSETIKSFSLNILRFLNNSEKIPELRDRADRMLKLHSH